MKMAQWKNNGEKYQSFFYTTLLGKTLEKFVHFKSSFEIEHNFKSGKQPLIFVRVAKKKNSPQFVDMIFFFFRLTCMKNNCNIGFQTG